ncbi:Sugar transferase involved in LPS biosynthesis (colanic, teichoic acid) [Fibrobacter sp. UWP2]|nr:Sugar transferase involved in LPS biosynthesis (colanic, teichoic acid) [Fibrobacter sp. UWP2]
MTLFSFAIPFTNHCLLTTFSKLLDMEQETSNPAIDNLLNEQKLKNIVYPARLFRTRLNEEFLRANRTRRPFLFIKIYSHQYDFLGWGRPSRIVEKTWRISLLTMFSHLRFIDVLGYLSDSSGIGVILLNSDMSTLEGIRKEILHKLNDAGLIQALRHRPKNPIFQAYLYSGLQEKDNLELDEKLKEFNSTNGSFFTLERLNLSDIWEHPHTIKFRHVIKRTTDLICASLALIILSPLLLFCALAVKLSDPKGPVIFKQTRVGRNGKLFTMYKFRSMYVDAEERKKELMAQNETGGKTFKMKNDPRIYPFGHVLRKFSLDELPQLVNIIKGDMSVVGPRPPIPSEVAEYEPWHRMRLSVTPGLTCIWQVSGRSNIPFEGQMRLDNDYIRRDAKLGEDLKLILKTFKVVFKGDGAY